MERAQEFLHVNELFAVYGETLTKRQQFIMREYYKFNLSIQEIADHLKISKAAVSDALKVATNHLTLLELKVGHIAYKARVRAFLSLFDETLVTKQQADLLKKLREE